MPMAAGEPRTQDGLEGVELGGGEGGGGTVGGATQRGCAVQVVCHGELWGSFSTVCSLLPYVSVASAWGSRILANPWLLFEISRFASVRELQSSGGLRDLFFRLRMTARTNTYLWHYQHYLSSRGTHACYLSHVRYIPHLKVRYLRYLPTYLPHAVHYLTSSTIVRPLA